MIGPKPIRATGLSHYPQCDAEVRQLADELWGDADGEPVPEHGFCKGRVISGGRPAKCLLADGVKPDFEFSSGQRAAFLDYIHRQTCEAEIYFVANRSNRWEQADCTFRVSGKSTRTLGPGNGTNPGCDSFSSE